VADRTKPGSRSARLFPGLVLLAQAALFLLLPLSGSPMSWGVFSSFNAEIAADLVGPGASPWDGYDGLVAGPMALGVVQAPLLALLGRIGLVHVLGMGALALATTALTWAFCDRYLGRPAALAATLLVAFPPPNTWFHQHVGAHHLLGPALVPAAMLLLWPSLEDREGRRRPWLWEGLGWTLMAGALFLTPTTVSLVVPLGAGWWLLGLARHRRAGALRWLRTLPPAVAGAAIGAAPLLYKALLHPRWGGLVPSGGASAGQSTKPLFLNAPGLAEVPGRLLEMVFVELPYGLHFGLHGLAPVGTIWAAAAGAAVAVLAWKLRGTRDAAWLPLLVVPPAALVVGLCTGWFVFHPGEGEPFPGDARHLLGLTWALSLCVGAALGALPRGARRPAWALVVLLTAASVGTQLQAVRWGDLEPDLRTPWRLENRLIHGFFAGPAFEGAPEAAVAACSLNAGSRRADCLRGLAMAWGFGRNMAVFSGEPGATDELRLRCEALERSAGLTGLAEECWVGLGFGLAHLQYQAPGRAIPLCARSPDLSGEEVRHCRVGVGYGFGQDFGFRPEVVRRWTGDLEEREGWAAGVGLYAGVLSRREAFVRDRCAELVGEELASACLEGARRNDRYMSAIQGIDSTSE